MQFLLCSLSGGVLLPLDELTGDAGVRGQRVRGGLRVKRVAMARHELALVVRASVTDDELRGVLVGHHEGGARQSVPERIRVVPLKGLLGHASVQIVPDLELILRH